MKWITELTNRFLGPGKGRLRVLCQTRICDIDNALDCQSPMHGKYIEMYVHNTYTHTLIVNKASEHKYILVKIFECCLRNVRIKGKLL